MNAYSKRVERLEAQTSNAVVLVVVDEGETQEAALARYEAKHGPLPRGAVRAYCSQVIWSFNELHEQRTAMTRSYEKRLCAIEAQEADGVMLLIQRPGESTEDTRARYEAQSGPIPRGQTVVFLSEADALLI